MRITYDRLVNIAYILLEGEVSFGRVKDSYQCDIKKVGGMINLDFDEEGKLIGVEILAANQLLPKSFLDEAEIIG